MRTIEIVFVALGSIWIIGTAGGDATREVGCIKMYKGEPGDYELVRANGDKQEVQPMLPLFEGDKVSVRAGALPIILSVNGKNSGYEKVVVCDEMSIARTMWNASQGRRM